MIRCRIAPLAALILLGQSIARADVLSSTPSPSPITPDYHASGGMLQIAIYFVLIVGLLIAGLYFTRTGFGALPRINKVDRKLIIAETRPLGNRQFLIVAEYENRKMLLGVCPGRIDYLSTLAGGGDDTFSTELPDKSE